MPLQPIDWGFIGGIATDVVFGYFMFKLYKYGNQCVTDIQAAKQVELSPNLAKELSQCTDGTMPYACVEGFAAPVGNPMTSRYGNKEGVIQSISLVEHKSKRMVGNTWTDTKNPIRDSSEYVPFVIHAEKQPDNKIFVSEPQSAHYLLDDLLTTYDKFERTDTSLVRRGLDLIAGEVSKGFHEMERMLLVGTQLLGIGELVLKNGKIRLQPPSDGKMYIVTGKSKSELLKTLSSHAWWAKVFFNLSVIIGGCLVTWFTYQKYKRYKEVMQQRRLLEEVRQERERMRREVAEQRLQERVQPRDRRDEQADTAAGGQEEVDDADACVVCLTNPRELVLVSCGHICLCMECADVLPSPLLCPVCRAPVERYLPYYRP